MCVCVCVCVCVCKSYIDFIEFTGGDRKNIKVPVKKIDSKPLVFDIKPKKEGFCEIIAQFWHKGIQLDSIKVKTKIVSGQAESGTTTNEATFSMDTTKKSADLTLRIRKIWSPAEGIKYQFEVISEEFDEDEELPFFGPKSLGSKDEQIRTMYEDIENFGGRKGAAYRDFNVDKLGTSLYVRLFPKGLQEFFWENRNKFKSIRVYSDEPWIPWEILKPSGKINGRIVEAGFLCETYAFSRWIGDIPPQKKQAIKKIKVVIPKDTNLEGAMDERDWIEDFCEKKGLRFSEISGFKEVESSLEEGGFDLLHFSTHGFYDENNPEMSGLVLEKNYELRATNLTGVTANFGSEHPIVIANACQTGQMGLSFGDEAWGLPIAFLEAGVFAYIGCHWSVGDLTAEKFTQTLYEKLNEGKPLDKAVQLARVVAREEGDPSWLAYTLYAPANTSIKFGN